MNIPILGDILDAVGKGLSWLRDSFNWWYAFLFAFIVTPVNWILDRVIGILGFLEIQVDKVVVKVGEIVSALGISGLWAQAAPWMSKANAVIPLDFIVTCISLLCSLWIVCAIIRISRRILPFI